MNRESSERKSEGYRHPNLPPDYYRGLAAVMKELLEGLEARCPNYRDADKPRCQEIEK